MILPLADPGRDSVKGCSAVSPQLTKGARRGQGLSRCMLLFTSILVSQPACGLRTPLDRAILADDASMLWDVTPSPDSANPGDWQGSHEDGSGSSPDVARSDGPLPDIGQDGRPPGVSDGPLANDGRDASTPDAADGREVAPVGDSQASGSYPLAQPGHGLTDILPAIVESEDCLRCVSGGCPAAITCANEPLCAAEVSCLVAICDSSSPLLPPPPMCVPTLTLRCGGFTDMTQCPTSGCSLPSPSAAITGLQAASCVYDLCFPPCGAPGYQ